jgi:hypothetical protein
MRIYEAEKAQKQRKKNLIRNFFSLSSLGGKFTWLLASPVSLADGDEKKPDCDPSDSPGNGKFLTEATLLESGV